MPQSPPTKWLFSPEELFNNLSMGTEVEASHVISRGANLQERPGVLQNYNWSPNLKSNEQGKGNSESLHFFCPFTQPCILPNRASKDFICIGDRHSVWEWWHIQKGSFFNKIRLALWINTVIGYKIYKLVLVGQCSCHSHKWEPVSSFTAPALSVS